MTPQTNFCCNSSYDSESIVDDSAFELQDLSADKKYFSQIPHVVSDLKISPYAKTLYCALKRWCWQGNIIILSNKILCEKTTLKLTSLHKAKKELMQPLPELNGNSLISVRYRKDPKTGQELPAAILIRDIWPENMKWIEAQIKEQQQLLAKQGGFKIRTGGVQNTNTFKREYKIDIKEKEKKESSVIPLKPPKLTASPPSPKAQELSSFLFSKLKEKNPEHKSPNLEKWSKEFDVMMRCDKRNAEDIKKIITWAFATGDKFWGTILQSPRTVRKMYDRAKIQMDYKTPQQEKELQEKKRRDKEDKDKETAYFNREWLKKIRLNDSMRKELRENEIFIHDLWTDHLEMSFNSNRMKSNRHTFYFNNSNFKKEFIEKLAQTNMRKYLLTTPIGKKILIKK